MSKGMTVKEAAEKLGITPAAVRQRVLAGAMKGRKNAKGRVTVYLNGDEQVKPQPMTTDDPLVMIAHELTELGRRLKVAIKDHDTKVRRETIEELGASLVETAKRKG